jgi:hypothetical protein
MVLPRTWTASARSSFVGKWKVSAPMEMPAALLIRDSVVDP